MTRSPPITAHLCEVETGDVRLEGPAGVGVTEHEPEVGHLVQHHRLVDLVLADQSEVSIACGQPCTNHSSPGLVLLPIYGGPDGAEGEVLLHGQARGRDDEVCLHECSILHVDPGLRESVDVAGDHGGLAGLESLEEVTFRRQTEPLLPGVVGWGKVLLKLFPETKNKICPSM